MCPRHEEIVRGFSSGDQLLALSYSLADDGDSLHRELLCDGF